MKEEFKFLLLEWLWFETRVKTDDSNYTLAGIYFRQNETLWIRFEEELCAEIKQLLIILSAA